MKRGLFVLLMVLVVCSFGCGKVERLPKPADKATSGEAATALPPDFPPDVPVLRGATLKLSLSQGDRTTVHLLATSSIADTAKFYEAEFRNHGWKIESESRSNEMYSVSAKKDKTLCGVTATRDAKGTLIRMAISHDRT